MIIWKYSALPLYLKSILWFAAVLRYARKQRALAGAHAPPPGTWIAEADVAHAGSHPSGSQLDVHRGSSVVAKEIQLKYSVKKKLFSISKFWWNHIAI